MTNRQGTKTAGKPTNGCLGFTGASEATGTAAPHRAPRKACNSKGGTPTHQLAAAMLSTASRTTTLLLMAQVWRGFSAVGAWPKMGAQKRARPHGHGETFGVMQPARWIRGLFSNAPRVIDGACRHSQTTSASRASERRDLRITITSTTSACSNVRLAPWRRSARQGAPPTWPQTRLSSTLLPGGPAVGPITQGNDTPRGLIGHKRRSFRGREWDSNGEDDLMIRRCNWARSDSNGSLTPQNTPQSPRE